MSRENEDIEVEEVIEEIDSSFNTSEYLSARMRGEVPSRVTGSEYSYFRRGMPLFSVFYLGFERFFGGNFGLYRG